MFSKPQVKKKAMEHITDVPSYRSVMSGVNGRFELSEGMRRQIAVLDVGQDRAIILVAETAVSDNQYLSLKARLERNKIRIVKEIVATQGLVMTVYSAEVSKKEVVEVADNPDIQKLVDYIVTKSIEFRATDIHICPRDSSGTGMVLFRVDGKMTKFEGFPSDKLLEVCGYIFTKMAEGNSRSEPSFNRNAMQSCTVPMKIGDQDIKLRYQSVKVLGGFDVVLRVLFVDKDEKTLTLNDLGYAQSHQRDLELASRKTVGVIIVAGVTGSGKSTTLKTLMSMSPHRHEIKSYSVEDPVEYKIYGVSQISVQRSSSDVGKNPFVESIRVLLRADPDVIMVGEIRDGETASLLKQVVQSGHQVMTTTHAASAVEIIERITSEEMGLLRQTISSRNFISALCYQKLLPLNCPKCKLPASEVMPEDRLRILERRFKINTSKVFVANTAEDNECPHCKGKGIRGQTVASEIIMPDQQFLRLIREGRDSEAEEYWRSTRVAAFDSDDMTGKTAFEHGLYKVAVGLVDPRNLEDGFEPLETYQIVEVKEVK